MTELLTSAQMRAIERAAIESGAATGLELMERAGQGVVEAIEAEWPEFARGEDAGGPRRRAGWLASGWRRLRRARGDLPQGPAARAPQAVVLCGPGNNGGDGFVVARLLQQRGWRVEVLLHGDPERLPPDARVNHARWCALGPVRALTVEVAAAGEGPAIVVDALFGIGLSRPLAPELARAVRAVLDRPPARGQSRCRVIAVDCPSGMDADTGDWLTPPAPAEAAGFAQWQHWHQQTQDLFLLADLTVTFHRPKIGHYGGIGCGALRVADIGLGRPFHSDPAFLVAGPLDPDHVRLIAPDIPTGSRAGRNWLGMGWHGDTGQHKYQRGHVVVLGGGPGQGGAARLAARAALRIGAGLVTIACPPEALAENAARLDAVMLRPVADAAALATMLGDDRISALCLGPGLGLARAREMVPVALDAGRRVVLDADALSAFRDGPDRLFALCHAAAAADGAAAEVVLTPHDGEFARLFPDLSQRERMIRRVSRVEAARIAARRAGATVLLKGAVTVIARPDGVAALHPATGARAAPQLATAGSGDVLAGFIAGLLASGLTDEIQRAIELATWLHVEAARSFGPGLIAEDLPEELPKVFRALGLS